MSNDADEIILEEPSGSAGVGGPDDADRPKADQRESTDSQPGPEKAKKTINAKELKRALEKLHGQLKTIDKRLERTVTSTDAQKLFDELTSAFFDRQQNLAKEHTKAQEMLKEMLQSLKFAFESHASEFQTLLAENNESKDDKSSEAASAEAWQRIVFGDRLSNDESLIAIRDELIQGMLAHDEKAIAFGAQMMLMQSAAADKFTPLARELGEAYYQWRPASSDTEDLLADRLISWLTAKAESIGVRNTIERVRVGDRFDSSRHAAIGPAGVEITSVHGWIVQRDTGKTVAKANVTVK